MELKIRQLIWNDIYDVADIVKGMDIKVPEGERDPQKAGMIMMKSMLGQTKGAKKQINEFLGSLFGITGAEFGKLSLSESIKAIKQLSELEDLKDFFDSVGQLMS